MNHYKTIKIAAISLAALLFSTVLYLALYFEEPVVLGFLAALTLILILTFQYLKRKKGGIPPFIALLAGSLFIYFSLIAVLLIWLGAYWFWGE